MAKAWPGRSAAVERRSIDQVKNLSCHVTGPHIAAIELIKKKDLQFTDMIYDLISSRLKQTFGFFWWVFSSYAWTRETKFNKEIIQIIQIF